MSQLHLFLAYAVAALALATLGTAAAAAVVGPPLRLLLDRLILLTLFALLLAVVSGLPLLVLVGSPADALHLVYGLAAPLILLGGRFLFRADSQRRRSLFVALAGLALIGIVYRLFTTGSPAG